MKKSVNNTVKAGRQLIVAFFILIVAFRSSQAQVYMIGANLSALKQAEDNGFKFKENLQPVTRGICQ